MIDPGSPNIPEAVSEEDSEKLPNDQDHALPERSGSRSRLSEIFGGLSRFLVRQGTPGSDATVPLIAGQGGTDAGGQIGGPLGTVFNASYLSGLGIQSISSLFTLYEGIKKLTSKKTSRREKKAARFDVAESSVSGINTGSGLAQPFVNAAAASALGGAVAGSGALIGAWWLGKFGRRAASAWRRFRSLGTLSKSLKTEKRLPESDIGHRLRDLRKDYDARQEALKFVQYARSKNRHQSSRAGLGSLIGGLGLAGSGATIAGLLGATAVGAAAWPLGIAAATLGLGLGAWKLGEWGRRKYQAAKLGGKSTGKALLSILTRREESLRQEARDKNPNEIFPFDHAKNHAEWLVEHLDTPMGQEVLKALNLVGHADFEEGDRETKIELIQHRLRSSG